MIFRVSLEIENMFPCMLYNQSGAFIQINVESISKATLIIVHHKKNLFNI